MRARFIGAAAVALVASAFVVTSPARAATGIHVDGTDIVEANGTPFVMRGTSHAHTWYATQTQSFADIAALGANTVRVVLSGGRWTANGASDVANVVSLCKAAELVCVLENHDTTGYGEQSGAVTLAQAVSYWNSVKSALVGQENHIIINIGNEPYGNTDSVTNWTTDTANAIKAMRANGFDHALMVDAPNWGQDWKFVMRDTAATVAAADPNKNTIFSIHMYGVFDTAAEITSYVQAFQSKGLPLVIGEFGHNHSDGDPDEVTIMNQTIGWLGWSWSGNGGGVEYLDQATNFNPDTLTSWGNQLFGQIKATAKKATIYN
jgi:mannan endo-1,4-beta-mannosidase